MSLYSNIYLHPDINGERPWLRRSDTYVSLYLDANGTVIAITHSTE